MGSTIGKSGQALELSFLFSPRSSGLGSRQPMTPTDAPRHQWIGRTLGRSPLTSTSSGGRSSLNRRMERLGAGGTTLIAHGHIRKFASSDNHSSYGRRRRVRPIPGHVNAILGSFTDLESDFIVSGNLISGSRAWAGERSKI